MANKKTPFAIHGNGQGILYVQIKAVMQPLIAMIDGLSMTFFGKEKTPYMTVDEAIAWREKENKFDRSDEGAKILEALKRAKESHAKGQIVEG